MSPRLRSFTVGAGLFLASAALLMLQVSFTRTLSVITWYHFAFFMISVAMFGLAASGLVVYMLPRLFPAERVIERAFAASLALAVGVPLCFMLFSSNPAQGLLTGFTGFMSRAGGGFGPLLVLQLATLYLTAVIPFFIGGLVGANLFRHMGERASGLYFFDLAGAGFGCLVTILVLELFGGPGAMAAVAILAGLAAAAFALLLPGRGRLALALVVVVAAGGMLATNARFGWLKLRYFRGGEKPFTEFEKWNSFSRVSVRQLESPDTLLIEIDAASNTEITRWDGLEGNLAYLLDGLIAVEYSLMREPDVAIIGSGGGVDILTAIAAGARRVTAIEVNPIIVQLMRGRYAGFSGRVYLEPRVEVVTDEARSWIRRSGRAFDVIQAGYVDTYAATAAGAFSLTENNLYTREAYQDYLAHLKPDGIVSMQRYYEDPPQQAIRLVSLALAALARRGDAHPSRHIAVVRKEERASVLVKNSEFKAADVERLERHCERAGLDLVAAPGRGGRGAYGALLAAADPADFLRTYPLDISPVTDDRPFFFYVVRPSEAWRAFSLRSGERMNARAVFFIMSLLVVVAVLAVLVLLLPLAFRAGAPGVGSVGAMGYFAALGLGFMLVEIGMLQRLMLFLGQPTLALSVVLSSLLISAGLGSAWTRRLPLERTGGALTMLLAVVLVEILVVALGWPPAVRALIGLERPLRIACAVAALLPVGFFLGTAFPIGLRRLAAGRAALIPWAWAVNGAASVLGSVLAMVVALNSGFTATLLGGAACYLAALLLAGRTAPTAPAAATTRGEAATTAVRS